MCEESALDDWRDSTPLNIQSFLMIYQWVDFNCSTQGNRFIEFGPSTEPNTVACDSLLVRV